ncbi:antistasin-like isoform X2 [Acanthaster planci]|uniref:Antistasin-like isoform X2 n=1 Tax=Acanthaster planci TaxID=133434 RepID=A0A8B7YE51_ACAPL|nr:antistasin-like isoform X2 [Acanthaster planci]
MTLSLSDYFILFSLLHCSFLITSARAVDCVECNIPCRLPLQRDENGCKICSCRLPECELLTPTWCVNPCNKQTCADYLTNGELEESQCVPKEGDEACETGCSCPEGQRVDVAQEFGAECVAKDECGCLDPDAPDGYLKASYKYKKTDETGELLCTCHSNHSVTCAQNNGPNARCPVVNGCPKSCLIKDRSGCERCTC